VPTVGERIAGRFELLAEAAEGGMGTVFKARDTGTETLVAVKVLRSFAISSKTRFERESAVLAQLDHPNIVKYVAHGHEEDGVYYLVMEWVEGETLLSRLDRVGLDATETVSMGEQISDALTLTHSHGVVHRDIKPSNLIFPQSGGWKLLDFGVARRANEPYDVTRTGTMIGTLGYMAPEQAQASRAAVDPRTDVFALGCVLYECLTGRTPFHGENLLAVRAKVLLVTPAPIREFAPEVPEPLAELVMRMLSKDPAGRPADGAAVAAALRALGPCPESPRRRVGGPAAPPTAFGATVSERVGDSVVCVVVVAPQDRTENSETSEDHDAERLELLAAHIGGQVSQLAEGALVVTVRGADRQAAATRAAQGALLALQDLPPSLAVIVAHGDEDDDRRPMARMIDRGVSVLEQARIDASYGAMHGDDSDSSVWVDERCAKLVEDRFELVRQAPGIRLVRARSR
jgi:hypothetical protein